MAKKKNQPSVNLDRLNQEMEKFLGEDTGGADSLEHPKGPTDAPAVEPSEEKGSEEEESIPEIGTSDGDEGSTELDPKGRVVSTRSRQAINEILAGKTWGSMDLTEPAAGSDLSALRTRATRDADGQWRVTGNKIFITSGHGNYRFRGNEPSHDDGQGLETEPTRDNSPEQTEPADPFGRHRCPKDGERKEPDSDAKEKLVGNKIDKHSCLVEGAGNHLERGPGGFIRLHIARPQFIGKRPK